MQYLFNFDSSSVAIEKTFDRRENGGTVIVIFMGSEPDWTACISNINKLRSQIRN